MTFPPDQRAASGLAPAAGRFLDHFGGLFVRVPPVASGPAVDLGRGAQVALAFTAGA